VVFAALTLATQLLAAQEADLSVRTEGRRVVASVELRQPPVAAIVDALQDGLKSEIVFELRLYRRQTGFLAWLGDRPIISLRETRVAAFDPFTARYVTFRNGRLEESFADQAEFLRHFLSLSEHTVGAVEAGTGALYYVLARIRLSPVRIIGPLNIVTLFSSENLVTTDWVEEPLGSR
jgi:hypothetical protein